MKNPLVEWTTAPLLEQNAHKSYIPVIVPSSHPAIPHQALPLRSEKNDPMALPSAVDVGKALTHFGFSPGLALAVMGP